MSVNIEYWYSKGGQSRSGANGRVLHTDADVNEIVDLIRIGWLTDMAVFASDGKSQLVVGGLDDGHAAACFWDSSGTYFTRGDGPDVETHFFQSQFPPYCQVTLDALREILLDFLRTGHRYDAVEWQSEEVSELTDEERAEYAEIFGKWPNDRRS